MYIDNIQLSTKNEKEFKLLIQPIRMCSQDRENKFGREKCDLLTLKKGNRQITEVIELPNQEIIRMLGEIAYYVVISERTLSRGVLVV